MGLPDGFTLRTLTPADLPSAQALLDLCESTDTGELCVHEMDLAVESRSPRFEFDINTWLVLDEGGEFAALGWLWTPHEDCVVTADFYVHPDCRDRGLDALYLDLFEARARFYANEPAGATAGGRSAGRPPGPNGDISQDADARLVLFAEPLHAARRSLILERGYSIVRQIFQMRLDFTHPIPVAEAPPGIAVRPIRRGIDDERLYAAHEEAFSEHYLFWPTPYGEWRQRTVDRPGLDPGLWLAAWDGEQVAGQVWVLPRGEEMAVEDLSVRKPWRGRGLGLVLLQEAFRGVAARGCPFVRLFVDAQNATGALELYLRAGMRQERRFEVFEKRLSRRRS